MSIIRSTFILFAGHYRSGFNCLSFLSITLYIVCAWSERYARPFRMISALLGAGIIFFLPPDAGKAVPDPAERLRRVITAINEKMSEEGTESGSNEP